MTALAKLFRATAFRLALAILAVSSVGAGVVLAIIAWQVVAVVDEEIALTIDAEAKGLTDAYNHDGLVGLYSSIEARKRQPGASLYLLTDPAGESLAGNVEQIPLEVLERHGFIVVNYRTNGPGDRVRQALVRIYKLPPGFLLLVGHDLGDRARIEGVMVRALAISLVFFAVLAAVGALFVARNVLGRIDDINTSAHRIMAGDLTGRLPVSGSGDELDRLAESLNAMLKRIGVLMEGLREVSDNIAHDLRTPLTRLRNHAEAALVFGDDAAYRTALEKTIEESDALIKVFNALLLIARAEAGGGADGQSAFDLGEAARAVAELYEPIAEEEGVDLAVKIDGQLYVRGNRELIGQSIANLVDNALKYGAPGESGAGRITPEIVVAARRLGDAVELTIADRGPGIVPADRERVLERFVRLEGSRSRPGSGLGLSLAAAVARMHGGTVTLEDNRPGLRVRVTLPAELAPPTLPAPALRGVDEPIAG